MAWKESAAFTGGSGQMAVMAELLHQQCNAAVPHIDIGMDVFAFRDDREDIARIQVKTSVGERYKKGEGYHAKFNIPMKQLNRADEPPLFYALVTRFEAKWDGYIVISRSMLKEFWNNGCGSENDNSGNLELYIQYRLNEKKEQGTEEAATEQKMTVFCGDFDLTNYLNAWESLPPLKPLPPID